jgi:predicted membrane-bound spermidine synthase
MHRLLFVLFFASGASGLVYEIVWVRQFGLLFGSTVYSAALVTGIFMCGLGLGSWLAGRWADARFARGPALPLRAYGVCELVIAAWALALVPGVPWLATLAAEASSYRAGADGWLGLDAAGSLVRYGCAALALLPVTLVMGGTLTLLIRHRIREDLAGAGWQVAALYAVNTAGAALGCLLTDTLLVPALGLFVTQLVAVGLNLFAGLGALALARAAGGATPERPLPDPAAAAAPAGAVGFASAALALGGFAAMALQIVWFRFLISLYGPYRPVFSLLLTIILVGIWLGSLLAGALVRRGANAAGLYAFALVGFGLYAAGALAFAPADGTARYQALVEGAGGAWPLYRSVLQGALGMVGIPALLSGAAYPLANALVQDRADAVGGRAGALYGSNTLGSVLGSWAGGFWLLPALGMQGTVGVVLFALAFALACVGAASGARRRTLGGLGAAVALLVAAGLGWQRMPPDALLRRSVTQSLVGSGVRIAALREGVNETIVVTESPFGSTLYTNGFGMSGTPFLGQRYMRAFVHLPMLISDSIESVMVMCFGVGNTVSAALAHPSLERIDVVDLSRDVLEQAGHFAASNGDVLADPRVRVHVNDARHHLRMLPGPRYDLITGEPPPLPHAGVVNLYTREFFALVRSRLRPGGIATYWLPAFQIGEAATRSVVRAFLEVFPEALLLDGHTQQLILVGRRDGPLVFDPARLRAALTASPALARDLRWTSLDRAAEWVGTLAATALTLERATAATAPLVDDRPRLEYESRELVWDRRLPAELFDVSDWRAWCPGCSALPPEERDEIEGYLEVIAAYYASPAFLRAQPGASPSFEPSLSPRAAEAVRRSVYLQDLLGTLPLARRRAIAAVQHGRYGQAAALLRPLARRAPADARLQSDFAAALVLAGKSADAASVLAAARSAAPADLAWRAPAADLPDPDADGDVRPDVH